MPTAGGGSFLNLPRPFSGSLRIPQGCLGLVPATLPAPWGCPGPGAWASEQTLPTSEAPSPPTLTPSTSLSFMAQVDSISFQKLPRTPPSGLGTPRPHLLPQSIIATQACDHPWEGRGALCPLRWPSGRALGQVCSTTNSIPWPSKAGRAAAPSRGRAELGIFIHPHGGGAERFLPAVPIQRQDSRLA